jgi:murein DD-endopeptidase MepM/ murein hydrolase activator NlpD
MQILITHGSMARTRSLQLNRAQLAGTLLALLCLLMLVSGAVYHFVFLKAARDGWPLVSTVVRFVVRDEIAQRERVMRENLDAMAQRLGEMQAKLVKLESMNERVSGLAGVKPEELKLLQRPGGSGLGPYGIATAPPAPVPAPAGPQGGPYLPLQRPSLEQLHGAVDQLDELADQHADLLVLLESRLFESRLTALMVPNGKPVDGPVSSGFGFRSDPFTGRTALHTGLDFPAENGATIMAAAGGVVKTAERHPAYGNMVEIDHGNGLVTRYAHASRLLARVGDLVRRGQTVAEVGSTGRSTGPHLHFEVLVHGVHQNPAKFLARR